MHTALQITGYLALYAEPLLPHTTEKLKQSLGLTQLDWNAYNTKFQTIIAPGHEIIKGELLFEKVEDDAIEKQLDKLSQSKEEIEDMLETPGKPMIDFDTFSQLELRVGQI